MPHTKSFSKLLASMEDQYEGELVPSKYKKRYGNRYDKGEIKSFAIAVAKSRGIKIDK